MSSARITIIKTGDPVAKVEERRGPFDRMIIDTLGDAWGGEYTVSDARAEAPPDPASAGAFIVTGSAANVPNREPWMLRLEAWLRDVVAAGTPTFGICFGHQILAQALGGSCERNPRGREIGTIVVERTGDDPIFDGIPREFPAQATHVDTAARLPPGSVALARSSLDDHQVIRFSEVCYGVQFHPEFDADVIAGYLEMRREILATEGLDADALLARVRDASLASRTLHNFVRHVAPRGRRAP
jgi:GMP synthase (glutamine-hydrolysing)